jgi:hypothetical protein
MRKESLKRHYLISEIIIPVLANHSLDPPTADHMPYMKIKLLSAFMETA